MTSLQGARGRDTLPGGTVGSRGPAQDLQRENTNKQDRQGEFDTGKRESVYVVFVYTLALVLTLSSLLAWVPRGSCSPLPDSRRVEREKRDLISDKVQRYLMQYGYLPASDMETGNLRTEDQLREAIRTMQRFGHIPITGRLDKATRALMKAPRCSLPDVQPSDGDHHRIRRFVKQGKKWDRFNLTWGVRNYPTKIRDRTGNPEDLSRWEVQREFRLATEVWDRVSRLHFKELEHNPDEADIRIDFKTGYHGDGYPFDGAGRTLAHAFYPGRGIGGDMHFDDEEPWVQHKDTDHTWARVSLFITAAHELGHALGLYHSDVEGALMSPYLIKFPSTFRLPEDDVRGIQELYGVDENWEPEPYPSPKPPTTTPRPVTPKPIVPTTPHRPPKKPSDRPDTCNTDYDAISVIRQEIYIFKGKYFWRVDARGNLLPNYPAEISRFWSKLPTNITHIDAVYERPHDANIVFFIGDKFYVCRGNQELLKVGRLKNLGLPMDLKKIDAAFVWGYNGRTYFFANTMYWRFDESIQHVELDYPRAMDMWQGVPYNIDSAFKHNGTTYFFQGKVFWEFDDFRMKVKPKSPALSAPFWLGCPNTENPYFLETTVTHTTSPAPAPPSPATTAIAILVLIMLLLPR
ncbi:matrix metalloproteinase-2-like [Eriocheir sinensis]|uniref:matrix metalloproteinase-2-like n=1 Tax=Eriocheir sinensis TaxID=95602 RepID=UPI0021C5A0AF|nr:matrix metalloproteinase-2-like [Eriocheir sinensis]